MTVRIGTFGTERPAPPGILEHVRPGEIIPFRGSVEVALRGVNIGTLSKDPAGLRIYIERLCPKGSTVSMYLGAAIASGTSRADILEGADIIDQIATPIARNTLLKHIDQTFGSIRNTLFIGRGIVHTYHQFPIVESLRRTKTLEEPLGDCVNLSLLVNLIAHRVKEVRKELGDVKAMALDSVEIARDVDHYIPVFIEPKTGKRFAILTSDTAKVDIDENYRSTQGGMISEHTKLATVPVSAQQIAAQYLLRALIMNGNSIPEEYERVLTLNPTCGEALNRMGDNMFRNSDYLQASRYYARAVRLDPNNSYFLINWTIARLLAGEINLLGAIRIAQQIPEYHFIPIGKLCERLENMISNKVDPKIAINPKYESPYYVWATLAKIYAL